MSETGRERILLAAERLIAERGADVPLRDIAAAAGQRNNSAVNYHFGSRVGLVHAVLEVRTAPQERRRLEMLALHETRGLEDDVHALVEMLVRPGCEMPYADGATHYARFLEQVRNTPVLAEAEFSIDSWPTATIAVTRLAKTLDHLPRKVRDRRLHSITSVWLALLADHERRWDGTGSAGPSPLEVDDITSMVSAMLLAPLPVRVG